MKFLKTLVASTFLNLANASDYPDWTGHFETKIGAFSREEKRFCFTYDSQLHGKNGADFLRITTKQWEDLGVEKAERLGIPNWPIDLVITMHLTREQFIAALEYSGLEIIDQR